MCPDRGPCEVTLKTKAVASEKATAGVCPQTSPAQRAALTRRHLVSADVELPPPRLGVALQQRGAHGEHLLHHRVLTQVVLALRAKVIVRTPPLHTLHFLRSPRINHELS